MTRQIFLDIIGLYYCLAECCNVSYEEAENKIIYTLKDIIRRNFSRNEKINIVKLWDKERDFKEKDLIVGSIRNAIRPFNINEIDECDDGSKDCKCIKCELHKAYCCLCEAQGGDVIISVVSNTTMDCKKRNSELNLDDGIIAENAKMILQECSIGIIIK